MKIRRTRIARGKESKKITEEKEINEGAEENMEK